MTTSKGTNKAITNDNNRKALPEPRVFLFGFPLFVVFVGAKFFDEAAWARIRIEAIHLVNESLGAAKILFGRFAAFSVTDYFDSDRFHGRKAVSYTHLTLPTICSV